MAYTQPMNGKPSTYGYDLPPTIIEPADKFMHSQSSYISGIGGQACCSIIFGVIAVSMWSNYNMSNLYVQTFGKEPTSLTEYNSDNAWTYYARYSWAYSIGFCCLWSCIGLCIGGIAKKCVTDRMSGVTGLLGCAILEGCCGCCQCLECLSYLGEFIMACIAASWLATVTGKEQACTLGVNYYATQNATLAVGAATTTLPPASPKYASCMQFMDGARAITILICFHLVFVMCCQCSVVGACFSGAKFAKDTNDAIEDDEETQYGDGSYY